VACITSVSSHTVAERFAAADPQVRNGPVAGVAVGFQLQVKRQPQSLEKQIHERCGGVKVSITRLGWMGALPDSCKKYDECKRRHHLFGYNLL
jgi:hypothetical protein